MEGERLGVIGGTGVAQFAAFCDWSYKIISTPYGEAVACEGELAGIPTFFLPRHGPQHNIPPHLINYRANITALKALGVRTAIGISAVGSINNVITPGMLAILSDFIDFTKNRAFTFYDGGATGVVHTDFSQPYCPKVSESLISAGKELGIDIRRNCVYICVEGPRYETSAEIRMFRQWGADVVGMTNVPEVTLAREAGICYGGLAVITNFAAGISPTPLSHEEVVAAMKMADDKITPILISAARLISEGSVCTSCFTSITDKEN